MSFCPRRALRMSCLLEGTLVMAWSAGEGLGSVRGHWQQRHSFACERLRVSSAFSNAFSLSIFPRLVYACVSMLCLHVQGRTVEQCEEEGRSGYVGMFLRRLLRRGEPQRARILRHACHGTADVMCEMSCLCMSDMRAVNQSHWGCMSSAAAHVPFFVGNSAWACCAGKEN